MKTPRATPKVLDFMRQYEGFKPQASLCVSGKKHPDGAPMYDIGFGNQFWEDGTRVGPGDEINSFEGEQLMAHWVAEEFEPAIERYMGDITFSQPMWDALVSAWYNLRSPETQPIMEAIRDGEYGRHVEMTEALANRWVKYHDPNDPGIRKGLYRRRVGEVLSAKGLPDPYEHSQELEYKQDFWPLIHRLEREIGIQAAEDLPPIPPLPSRTPEPDPPVIDTQPEPEPMPEPVVPAPVPQSPTGYGRIDPTAPPKEWWESRREWGRIIQLFALSGVLWPMTSNQMLAVTEIGGLIIASLIGFAIQKWGERGATRYTK